MIATYLIEQGIYEAANGFSGMSEDLLELVYTQLIAPKEYQQKQQSGAGMVAKLH